MQVYQTMVKALDMILREYASTKTDRYFIRNLDSDKSKVNVDGKDYPKKMCDVVRTFLVVMSAPTASSMIDADGQRYPVNLYEFPTQWWMLAKLRKVWGTIHSAEIGQPWFRYQHTPNGDVMTPDQVKRFFVEYNVTQTEGVKIETSGVPAGYDDFVSVLDFKALCVGDRMGDMNHEGGVIEEIAAQIVGIEHPMEAKYLKTWEPFDERSVAKWLMSVELKVSSRTSESQPKER